MKRVQATYVGGPLCGALTTPLDPDAAPATLGDTLPGVRLTESGGLYTLADRCTGDGYARPIYEYVPARPARGADSSEASEAA